MSATTIDGDRVWRGQMWTIAKSEVGRTLFSRRSFAVYLLVAMPLALMLLRAIFMPSGMRANSTHAVTDPEPYIDPNACTKWKPIECTHTSSVGSTNIRADS